MLSNPVLISVAVMIILSLLKLNILLALIIAALAGGLISGMSIVDTMDTLIGGMGKNSETALNYILLGALAAAIQKTGAAKIITQTLSRRMKGTGKLLIFIIALISIFSQNLIPVHIAFIPILIPPLIPVMNKLKIDRRAVASALTFGLKAPYIVIPAGYGLIFHNIIRKEMATSGLALNGLKIWQVMWIPGLAMVVGLLVAVLITYRKPREYQNESPNLTGSEMNEANDPHVVFNKNHAFAIIGAVAALIVQLTVGSLVLGAILGLAIMIISGAIKWSDIDDMIRSGIGMMGFIAFVMLVASGYGDVIRATGGVDTLVASVVGLIGTNKLVAATCMIVLGLLITLGIGTSFGTIPIIAAIYVPLATELGFSAIAIVLLIGSAAALGDAGSPASDSTLGPTAGLNIDHQHDHIWDTCVPTFLHYNIPIMIFGIVGAMIL
ncbi:Na+/H+ antiporter family protein [Marinilactibacillus sp. Marseille-P9653]|uniref:Na+/H+ antiporter family protein n=1 Tax=Marinilactibacillus sp. Marseille-P9653 TaxID=2866583 RepID=UPI001CE3E729|nr:Na+/H+ antiporter NhaC family protein [Marinilactibacillus sp. Marseille-P9653]